MKGVSGDSMSRVAAMCYLSETSPPPQHTQVKG